MPANGRATVNPATIRGLSVGAIITTILLGLGWLLGAVWSAAVASAHIDPPSTFEDMTPVVTIPLAMGLWAGFLIAGTLWALWQRSIAVAAIPWGVRDPDWHAYAWFSPIVMWWEPVRNVRQLSTYLLRPEQRWLVPAWWASWVAFRLTAWLVIWQLWMPPRLLLDPRIVAIAAAAATAISTTLAVILIHLLTSGVLARVRMPYVMDFVKRPFPLSLPLFVVGIVCRVATPIVVIELVTLMADRFS